MNDFSSINNKNIVLQQILIDKDYKFHEVYPFFIEDSSIKKVLLLNENRDLIWMPYKDPSDINYITSINPGKNINIQNSNGTITIDCSLNLEFYMLDASGRIKNTELYYSPIQLGIGRQPIKNYKLDIAINSNETITALHVGDGSFGFSMGNGTSNGFIPEIIGIGSDKDDAGLYFVGVAGNDNASNIPLVIVDGRNSHNSYLQNRPIFGITSFDYQSYKLIVDQFGRVGIGKIPEIYKLEIEGTIISKDIKIVDVQKENIEYIKDSSIIYELKPIKFLSNGKEKYGFKLNEIAEFIPSIIGLNNDGSINDISYLELIPLMISTIKSQQLQINRLEELIKTL